MIISMGIGSWIGLIVAGLLGKVLFDALEKVFMGSFALCVSEDTWRQMLDLLGGVRWSKKVSFASGLIILFGIIGLGCEHLIP